MTPGNAVAKGLSIGMNVLAASTNVTLIVIEGKNYANCCTIIAELTLIQTELKDMITHIEQQL